MQVKDEASVAAATALYNDLIAAGVDVLLDDRNARPGVKFADAELIGIPYRVAVGPKALAEGNVEYTPRATGETELVSLSEIAELVSTLVA